MFWLTEEIGFVCGNKIDHMEQIAIFPGIAKNEVKKLLIIIHAQAFNFFVEPAFQHRPFVYRKFDTILARDVCTESVKTFIIHANEEVFHFECHWSGNRYQLSVINYPLPSSVIRIRYWGCFTYRLVSGELQTDYG